MCFSWFLSWSLVSAMYFTCTFVNKLYKKKHSYQPKLAPLGALLIYTQNRQIYHNHHLYNKTTLQPKMHHTMTKEDNDNRKVIWPPPPINIEQGRYILRKGYFHWGEGKGQALAHRYQAFKILHLGRQSLYIHWIIILYNLIQMLVIVLYVNCCH